MIKELFGGTRENKLFSTFKGIVILAFGAGFAREGYKLFMKYITSSNEDLNKIDTVDDDLFLSVLRLNK